MLHRHIARSYPGLTTLTTLCQDQDLKLPGKGRATHDQLHNLERIARKPATLRKRPQGGNEVLAVRKLTGIKDLLQKVLYWVARLDPYNL